MASHQPQLQKLWREGQSRKWGRGFQRHRGCKEDLRVSTDPVPNHRWEAHAEQLNPSAWNESRVLGAHRKGKDGLALLLAPRLLEESR